MKLRFLLAPVLVVSACGSAEFTSINRSFNPAAGDSRLIDAKQRAIISVPGEDGRQIVCAEPSPDALQATAAAISASGGLNQPGAAEAALQAAAGVNESVASIGLRTQSIQLLRDSYYRNCEGFAAGALDDIAFNIMHQRFQNHTVALLAIEQLTGASIAPAAAVSASSEATASSEINVTNTNNLETSSTSSQSSEADENTESSDSDQSSSTAGKAAGSVGGSTSFTINAPGNADPEPLPEHVSLAVAAIAHDALNQDYGVQLCLEYARNVFTSEKNAKLALKPFGKKTVGLALEDLAASQLAMKYCQERLEADSQRQAAINQLVTAKADIMKAVAKGIANPGRNHLSDKHALEIIEAINLTLPTDPATAFQTRGQQLSTGGLAKVSE
ncbi:MAG: hypothetical protein AAGC79_16875 [Pseudomonadota bacterium]